MVYSEFREGLRTTLLLSLISFLVSAGFSAVNLVLPYYLIALRGLLTQLPDTISRLPAHHVAVEVGLLVSSFMASRALLATLSGWISDTIGRKRSLFIGTTLYILIMLLYYAWPDVKALFLGRIVQGIASALVWPTAEALLVASIPQYWRTRALSIYIVSMSAGSTLGPLIGALAYFIAKNLVVDYPLNVLRTVFLILTVVLIPTVISAAYVREASTPKRDEIEKDGIRATLAKLFRRELMGFYINALINGVSMGMLTSVTIVYILDFVIASVEQVAILLSIPSLIGIATAYPLAHYADRLDVRDKRRLLLLTSVISRSTLAFIGLTRDFLVLLILFSIMDIAINIFFPLLRGLEAELVGSSMYGKLFGIHQAFFNTGMIVGPLIGTHLYSHLYHTNFYGVPGLALVFFFASTLGLLGTAILSKLYRV